MLNDYRDGYSAAIREQHRAERVAELAVIRLGRRGDADALRLLDALRPMMSEALYRAARTALSSCALPAAAADAGGGVG